VGVLEAHHHRHLTSNLLCVVALVYDLLYCHILALKRATVAVASGKTKYSSQALAVVLFALLLSWRSWCRS
jgi:hypothetical protein